jgi:hypothetical protein
MLTHIEIARRDGVVKLNSDSAPPLEVALVAGEVPDLAPYLVGAYAEPPPPVPSPVSRLQGLLALHDAGLLAAVEAIIAQSDARTQLAWTSTPDFHRDSAALNAIWGALGKTQAELDDLFRTAANITV